MFILSNERQDLLRGKDLVYPNKRDYTKYWVYSNGKVIADISRSSFNAEEFLGALPGKFHSRGLESAATNYAFDEVIRILKSTDGIVLQAEVDEDTFWADRNDYQAIMAERNSALIADVFEYYDVTDNPKAQKAWDKAWEHGHSAGHGEVISYFHDFVDLIL